MKIIFIHLLNDFSGSPKVLSQLINGISNSDFEYKIITSQSESGFLSKHNKKHIIFYDYHHHGNKLITLFRYLQSQIKVFTLLFPLRKDKDIVIYINTLLPFGAAIFGKIYSKPVIYHIHEVSITPSILKSFLLMVLKKTASKIIYVSRYLKEEYNISSIKSEIISNSIPTDFLLKANHTPYSGFSKNGVFRILMICSLKKYKGILEFITIAKKLKKNSKKFILNSLINQNK